MKRFYLLAALILGLTLSGCKETPESKTLPPVIFEIIITDSDGNIIVEQDGGDEIIKNMLSIEWHEHISSVKEEGDELEFIRIGDKYLAELAPFIGRLFDNPKTVYCGLFYPEDNYRDETFKLIWNDGTTDIVKFSTYVDEKIGFSFSATINGIPLDVEDKHLPIIHKTLN